jgi:hypothetical protein
MRRPVIVFIVGLLAGGVVGFGFARLSEDDTIADLAAYERYGVGLTDVVAPPAGMSPQRAIRECRRRTRIARTELREYCSNVVLRPGRRVGVVGSDGELIRCPDDKPLRVRLNDNPPPGLGRTTPSGEAEGVVPRCGPEGGGKDAQPIWVPTSVGRDRVTAPQRFVDAQSE